MSDERQAKVEDLVTPIVAARGADLEYVSLRRAGRKTVVVIAVDTDGGVMLDDIAEYSREISDALDDSGVMGESPYTLEVTSPGVHRPLTLPRHWRRAKDRMVKVTLQDGQTIKGRIVDSDDAKVVLDVRGDQREFAYADVAKAVVQVEFGEAGS